MRRKHEKEMTPVARELRKNMTSEEKRLWYEFLRNYPVRFLRQKVMYGFVADFYCREAKLVVELNGEPHFTSEGRERDIERDAVFESYGFHVLHLENAAIRDRFDDTCERIDECVKERIGKE